MTKTAQPTVALAMIVKGVDEEAPLLAQCLASVSGYVDAIYIDINHKKGENISQAVRAIAEQYDAKIYTSEWKDNFVKARNRIFAKVPKKYDWIMWLDSDDVVDDPERIHSIVATVPLTTCGIWVKYDYAHDEFGNCTVNHWVCRIARNNGTFAWKSSFDDGKVAVHETLVETRQTPKVANDEFKVIHKSNAIRSKESLDRNIRLLEAMDAAQQKKGDTDPRILFYLGTHYFDAFRLTEAKNYLQQYMLMSGWNEERAEALVYLGLIYAAEGKQNQAKHAYLLAIGEDPVNARSFVELGQLEYQDGRYDQSVQFLEKALAIKPKKFTVVQAPMQSTYRAYMLMAQSLVNIGGKELQRAKKFIQKALKLRPLDPEAQDAKELIENLIKTADITKSAVRLVRALEDAEEESKVPQLIESLPIEYAKNPAIINIRNHYTAPVKWPKKSVALYLGPTSLIDWGPWSLNETGIGGSEEAVIYLSQELTALGYKVVVYGNPGTKDGNYDGIEWKNYWEFNPNDTFDILMAWRSPWFFDGEFIARKKYLWLHDLMDKEEFTADRISRIDRVIFVSQWHADQYKDVIPDKKRFASGNGIAPKDFENLKRSEDTYRLIYTSANERGLRVLYDIWPDVKKAVPLATLDSYYGWESFKSLNKENPERVAWMNEMIATAKKLNGVTAHGRMPQDQLNKELSQSAIFAYPCIFPEVYCISYIKALAAGCYTVTSDYAVLSNYAKYGGIQVPYDSSDIPGFKETYKKALIKALKDNNRKKPNSKAVCEKFSWNNTAQQWVEDFEA